LTRSPEAQAESAPGAYSGFENQFINCTWKRGGSRETITDVNPFSGETLVEIPAATQEDLDQAYQAAQESQLEWIGLAPARRALVMRHAAATMEPRREEIIRWIIHESGGTRIKASLEWDAVHSDFLEASGLPYQVEGRILTGDVPGKECRVYRRPVGVVGVISPWNWPFQLTARSVAPAVALGNAVVLKPASDTHRDRWNADPKILEEAGLPAGVLNVVIGKGSEIGMRSCCIRRRG
jgi:aldehyde dehydrogenase (NAD+)